MKPLSLHFIEQALCRIDELLAEFWSIIDDMTVFLAPDLQKVISEKFELALEPGIILSHCCNILFESINITLRLLFQLKLEDLNSKLHLHIVIEADTCILALANPSLHFIDILRIKISSSTKLIKCLRILHSDLHICHSFLAFLNVDI